MRLSQFLTTTVRYLTVAVVVIALGSTAINVSPAAALQPADDTALLGTSGATDQGASFYPLEARQAEELVAAQWEIPATVDGAASAFQADVVASAAIERLVVDIYVDGILVDSVSDPNTIFVNLTALDLEPAPTTTVSLVGREIESAECSRFDGVISYRNAKVLRQPHQPTELASAVRVSVDGDDVIEVANIAAAVERETDVSGATVALEAPVAVSVQPGGDDQVVLATITGLADQRSLGVPLVVVPGDPDRRAIQRVELPLERTGSSTFVSATGFGGRVEAVAIHGEIHSTPLGDGGGFAIEINGEVVVSGEIDAEGYASFETVVADWPRDADVAVRLALREDRNPCSPVIQSFTGTSSLVMTPQATAFDEPELRDFPQRFLESDTVGLWVEADVPSEWVAVAVAAIQDTSVSPLHFHAATEADASLRLLLGSRAPAVVDGSLQLSLDETFIEELSTDRFWNVGVDVELADTSIAVDNTVAITEPGASSPRAGWLFTAVVAAIGVAILLLFVKNSRQAP